ncbi:PREDICTED: probable inactive receptor-like kinase SSP [Camelina sativa]|uniref:Serine/threonine-protein kinase BSK n=1 Tax=Camelina sativa TaxID=90675 RepID=A0ABM1RPM1_CAMSA|nr:PREDICTED: probable inactive receptor-like kinase SSP [Camelina sativa]
MENQEQTLNASLVSQLENDEKFTRFTEFFYSDLKTATKNFSSDEIVSENGEESSNIVYKGQSQSFGSIAVKKFKNTAWPDRDQFVEEARKVWQLRHKGVVNLIGCCSEGDERLLVAEFIPSDTLATRLFHQDNHTMEWSVRLRIAYQIAEALDHCSTEGFASYNNLSACTVLFDEDGDACLSCFGLMKESIRYILLIAGNVNHESVAYRFGSVLLNLLTGKQISPNLAHKMVHGQNATEYMDPKLEVPTEDAFFMFGLASQAMGENSMHIPTYELLQMKKQHEKRASQTQQPKQKPATLVGGSRRSGPNRHKKPIHQTDEEIQAHNKEEYDQMQIRVDRKAQNQLDKPKGKNKMRPSKPGQPTKPRRNQF